MKVKTPNAKNDIGKDPNGGERLKAKEKWAAEDKMFGWHHRLSELDFEQAQRDSGGERSLTSSSPWGCKEPDTT